MAFIDFTAGETFTAAQADTLMRQGCMSFASSAARASALSGITVDGMITWLEDTESLEYYVDSAPGDGWVPFVSDINAALDVLTNTDVTNLALAAADATSKANAAEAAAVVTANAYTDSVKIETHLQVDTSATTNNTNTTPTVVLDTPDITSTRNGSFIVTCSLDVTLASTVSGNVAAFVAQLVHAGSIDNAAIIWRPYYATVGTRQTLTKTWIIPEEGGGGTRDFRIQVFQDSSVGQFSVSGQHCQLKALFVG